MSSLEKSVYQGQSLVYYSPSSYGGLADYAHEQANSLVDLGVDVYFLCAPSFILGRQAKYHVISVLKESQEKKGSMNKFKRFLQFVGINLFNFWQLSNYVKKNNFKYVLFGSYVEYLAPLWSRNLFSLSKQGTVFGSVIHDPVRDFVLGPIWWHSWSIACGYSFLREAFVHEPIKLDTQRPMPQLRTNVIPHGTYQFPQARKSRNTMREELDIPNDSTLFLAFGHIRDGKNLDLALRAIADFPDIYLLVAGKVISSTQKPVSYYQELAQSLNINQRCRWLIDFIPNEQIGDFFNACDFVLLTYDANFQSASGVLNTAIAYKRPCLASAGKGNLQSVVMKYNLGVFVIPDSIEAISDGIQKLLIKTDEPLWSEYEIENSWRRNAEIVCQKMFD